MSGSRLFCLIILLSSFMITGVSLAESGYDTFTATDNPVPDNYKAAMDEIRAENKVINAVWVGDITLWVGVKDDGTRRDGYAQYICLLLHDHKINNVYIHIMEPWNVKKELGYFACCLKN